MANEFVSRNHSIVKEIFETMEYTDKMEHFDSALAWLKQNPSFSDNEIPIRLYTPEEELAITTRYNNENEIELIFQKLMEHKKLWLNTKGTDRAKLLNNLANEIEKHTVLICQLEMIVNNMMMKDTKYKTIRLMVDSLRFYASLANLYEKWFSNYQPYGVSVHILNNNHAFGIFWLSVSAALAAGNVILLQTTLNLKPLAELIIELSKISGFPDGIIRVICSEEIKFCAKLTFIGNLSKETRITFRKDSTVLHLEKTSAVVFDSADLDSACDLIIESAWSCHGTFPWGIDKIYVQETISEQFTKRFLDKIQKLQVSYNAIEKNCDIILNQIDSKNNQIPKINKLPILIYCKHYKNNNKTNLISEHDDNVVSLESFRTASEMVTLLNETGFKMGISIWTENISLAGEMSEKLKASNIWINTHGFIDPSVSFSTANGISFGGVDGIYEYLMHANSNNQNREKVHVSNDNTYFYYGGAFKKPESGLTESARRNSNSNDALKCMEVAKKNYENWNKLSLKTRGQRLLKLSELSASITTENPILINKWTEYLREWSTLSNISETLTRSSSNSPSLRTIKESLGIIVIETWLDSEYHFLSYIVAALLYGNSIIIINYLTEFTEFLTKLCKILPSSGIPAGLFNCIFELDHHVSDLLNLHKDVSTHIYLGTNSDKNEQTNNSLYDYNNVNSYKNILKRVTVNKLIWTSVGESFL